MTFLALTIPLFGGAALGGMFYGGLWFTVERLLKSAGASNVKLASFHGKPQAKGTPAGIALCSLMVRFAIALAGFIWLANGRWQNAVACLVGFEAARLAIVRWRRCT